MTSPVVFPDVVAAVLDDLRSKPEFSGYTMAAVVPNPRPGRLVLARRIGGVRRNVAVDDVLVGFEVWSPTREEAHDVAQCVRAYVSAMAGSDVNGVLVGPVVETGGVADLPDPDSTAPRFVWTAQLSARGRVL